MGIATKREGGLGLWAAVLFVNMTVLLMAGCSAEIESSQEYLSAGYFEESGDLIFASLDEVLSATDLAYVEGTNFREEILEIEGGLRIVPLTEEQARDFLEVVVDRADGSSHRYTLVLETVAAIADDDLVESEVAGEVPEDQVDSESLVGSQSQAAACATWGTLSYCYRSGCDRVCKRQYWVSSSTGGCPRLVTRYTRNYRYYCNYR